MLVPRRCTDPGVEVQGGDWGPGTGVEARERDVEMNDYIGPSHTGVIKQGQVLTDWTIVAGLLFDHCCLTLPLLSDCSMRWRGQPAGSGPFSDGSLGGGPPPILRPWSDVRIIALYRRPCSDPLGYGPVYHFASLELIGSGSRVSHILTSNLQTKLRLWSAELTKILMLQMFASSHLLS